MGRKNRKVSANTAAAGEHAAWIGGLLLLAGIMAIVNVLANTTCNQLQASIGEKERQLAKLEDAYQRENAQLSSLRLPESLNSTLSKHGMAMDVAQPHQVIKMSRSGKPYPVSMAALARARGETGSGTAAYRKTARRR